MLKSLTRTFFQRMGYEVRRVAEKKTTVGNPLDIQKSFLNTIGITAPTIYDIGAHHGQTVKAYRSRFAESMIHCFEPFPVSVEFLKAQYQNDLKVKIIPSAIADEPGQRTFYVNNLAATHSLFPRNTLGRRYYPSNANHKDTIQAQVTTIDEYTFTQKVDRVDILKLDIQGGELMALKGATRTLKENYVSLIYTEAFFVPHYEDSPLFYHLWQCLAEFGYTLFNVYNLHTAINGQLRFGDALFVSQHIRENVINNFPEEP